MPYIIICRDKPDAGARRTELRPKHLAYLDEHADKLLVAGAFMNDDATAAKGSMLLYDTDDRAEAEAFAAGDPFAKEGVFGEVTVTRYRMAFYDRKNIL